MFVQNVLVPVRMLRSRESRDDSSSYSAFFREIVLVCICQEMGYGSTKSLSQCPGKRTLSEAKKLYDMDHDAYMLTSAAVDLHVTEVVDGVKGVHATLPKSIFVTAP